MQTIILECQGITKTYPASVGNYHVFSELNFTIKRGEFVSIIGHSGCGKSTIVSMIAGLCSITAGNILMNGKKIRGPGLERGLVFQSSNLLPWMNSMENVLLSIDQAFPTLSKSKRKEIAIEALQKVGLSKEIYQPITSLSEGSKQRVGLARAIAVKPSLLLLDEPFGRLDSITRDELQSQILSLWRKENLTCAIITHDINEAIRLSDRIIMMTPGPNSKIGGILENNLPRPRKSNSKVNSSEHKTIKTKLLNFLERDYHYENI